ncbi:MAG: hypothetical protein Q8K65_06780 [Alphaproteobacteria bacterium]|nr:hypothetical protein [Alphaproteobacteria bacterium]
MHRKRPIARTITATPATQKLAIPVVAGTFLALLMAVFLLSGCAGALPGGTDAVNKSFYSSNTDLESWVSSLEAGMPKEEVFARLGRAQKDFRRLARNEIVGILFGGEDAGIPVHFYTDENILAFLESLEGYRIEYKSVKRRHGLTSPIRMQTDSKGFDYSLSMVFKDGKLYQKPYLTGGQVNNSSTKTLFDYLNPGMLLNTVN